jgi:hypothetical protein
MIRVFLQQAFFKRDENDISSYSWNITGTYKGSVCCDVYTIQVFYFFTGRYFIQHNVLYYLAWSPFHLKLLQYEQRCISTAHTRMIMCLKISRN